MTDDGVYQTAYPGTPDLQWGDKPSNELRRWFCNYRVNKYASFCVEYEWITIEEQVRYTARGRRVVWYQGVIGSDDYPAVLNRQVRFEVGAPPPPSFYKAATRRKPEPPQLRAPSQEFVENWPRYGGNTMDGFLNEMQRKCVEPLYIPTSYFAMRSRFDAHVLTEPVKTAPPPPRYLRN